MDSATSNTDEPSDSRVNTQLNTAGQNVAVLPHKYNTRLAEKNRQNTNTSSKNIQEESLRSNRTNAYSAGNGQDVNPTETQLLSSLPIEPNMETITTQFDSSSHEGRHSRSQQSKRNEHTTVFTEPNENLAATQYSSNLPINSITKAISTSTSGSFDEGIRKRNQRSTSTNMPAVLTEPNESLAATKKSQFPLPRILIISIPIVGLALLFLYLYFCPTETAKNLNENRDFTTYYDIADLKRYFETEKTNDCDSMVIFRPSLPQMILKSDYSASSFMTLAKYGSGKTLLRCEYMKSLSSNNYMKIFISDEQITEYLDRYVSKINTNESNDQTQNPLKNWSENEFAQVLLSTLVTQFINTYHQTNFEDRDLVLDKKIKLITIICYYYNDEGISKLETFINSLLGKGVWSKYKIEDVEEQLRQENEKDDEQLWEHLQEDLETFIVLRQDLKRLRLLMLVLRGEKSEDLAREKQLYGNTIQDLIEFSSFIKKSVKKTPVFAVDGIDDNKLFVRDNKVNTAALESFCRSSISSSIVRAALTGNFYLSLFYPKVDNINLENIIIPKDKFLVHTINWNKNSLINYADYVLAEMNKKASSWNRCKPFPDFKTLVNYYNKEIAKIIDKITTPRQLHGFLSSLMEQMNSNANNVKIPFEATLGDVEDAFKNSLKSVRNESRVSELHGFF